MKTNNPQIGDPVSDHVYGTRLTLKGHIKEIRGDKVLISEMTHNYKTSWLERLIGFNTPPDMMEEREFLIKDLSGDNRLWHLDSFL